MKDMEFNAKSAWAMIVALSIAGLFYVVPVLLVLFGAGGVLPPGPLAIGFVVILIVISIIAHVIIALSNVSEATETRDERDRAFLHFAGHWSGIALAIGVIASLLTYLLLAQGDMLFHMILTSLILASLVEYVLIIIAYRQSV
ncbi:MAG: hypothetical protein AAF926_08060 [Pseudomonadota bacterium]